jgi:hypothetical protein
MTELVYLAVPYEHEDPKVMEERFRTVSRAAARLIREGVLVLCPISHSHPIKVEGKLPSGWDHWHKLDTAFMSVCKRMLVLKLPGWKESVGVAGEIEYAKKHDMPVGYLEEDFANP